MTAEPCYPEIHQLESVALFEAPTSIDNVQSWCVAVMQGKTIRVSFSMHPDDLDTLVESTYVETLDSPPIDSTHFLVEYLPEEATSDGSYLYGIAPSTSTGPQQQLLVVNTSNLDQYTVYIVATFGD